MLRDVARASLDGVDRWWANSRWAASDSPHLTVALLHAVHRSRSDSRTRALAPNQEFTLEDLRRFLDAMLTAGYAVVSTDDIAAGLPRHPKLLALTFDDGYYNNTWALRVLEEFHAPATFFIATGHVLGGKAFWWDVVARQLYGMGKSRPQIERTLEALKKGNAAAIEQRLLRELGPTALMPAGDADRPLDGRELRDLARSRWVLVGNHTVQHTILTRCAADECAREVSLAHRQLEAITGRPVNAIAYPNGDFSDQVVAAADAVGYKVGFTCVPGSNPTPDRPGASLTLGRHLIWGGTDFRALAPQLAARCLPGARLRAAVRKVF